MRLSEPPGRSCEGGTERGASEGSYCSLIPARALVNGSRTGSRDPCALYREGSRLLLPPQGSGGRPGVSCACSKRGGPHLPPQNAGHAGHVSWAGPGSVAGENPASSPPPGLRTQAEWPRHRQDAESVHNSPSSSGPGLVTPHHGPEPPRQPGSLQEGGRRAQRLQGRDRGRPRLMSAAACSP